MLTNEQLASIEEDLSKPIADPNTWARKAVPMLLAHARELREELDKKRGACELDGKLAAHAEPGPEHLSRRLQLLRDYSIFLTQLATKASPSPLTPEMINGILDDARLYTDGAMAREKAAP